MSNWLLSTSEQHTLEALLEALPEELDLTLATLHGLVTGLAVIPLQPTPDMWSALTLHGTEPLDSNRQTELFELLNQWHQRVDRMLQSGEAFELPIDLSINLSIADAPNDDKDDDPDASAHVDKHSDEEPEETSAPSEVEEWCIGFIEAVVSAEQFEASLGERAEEITELTIPAAFIAGVLDGTEWDEIYDREDIIVDLLAALPEMVSDLYLALRVQVVDDTDSPQ